MECHQSAEYFFFKEALEVILLQTVVFVLYIHWRSRWVSVQEDSGHEWDKTSLNIENVHKKLNSTRAINIERKRCTKHK